MKRVVPKVLVLWFLPFFLFPSVFTSANFLGTLGYISSGPIDLCMFRFLRWSKPDLPLQWEGLCPSGPHLAVHQGGWARREVASED